MLTVGHNSAAGRSATSVERRSFDVSRSLERLSSALRLNRASDDAAGIAIAESFQAQVRGGAQAGRNVQDGINLARIADGGLQQVSAALQRMRELVVQAANGTTDTAGRQAIQLEIDQLNRAIDDVVSTAQFNGIFPLTRLSTPAPPPSGSVPPATPGAPYPAEYVFLIDNTGSTGAIVNSFINQISDLVARVQVVQPGARFGVSLVNGADDPVDGVNKVIDLTSDPNAFTPAALDDAIRDSYGYLNRGGTTDFFAAMLESLPGTDNPAGISDITVADSYAFAPGLTKRFIMFTDITREGDFLGPFYSQDETQASLIPNLVAQNVRLDIVSYGFVNSSDIRLGYGDIRAATGGRFYDIGQPLGDIIDALAQEVESAGPAGGGGASTGASVTLQVGANNGQTVDLHLTDARAASLGTTAIDMTVADPASFLNTIDRAMAYVAGEASRWGAYENRLTHTAANLATGVLEQASSLSRIRDVDTATEVARLTRGRLLQEGALKIVAISLQVRRALIQTLHGTN